MSASLLEERRTDVGRINALLGHQLTAEAKAFLEDHPEVAGKASDVLDHMMNEVAGVVAASDIDLTAGRVVSSGFRSTDEQGHVATYDSEGQIVGLGSTEQAAAAFADRPLRRRTRAERRDEMARVIMEGFEQFGVIPQSVRDAHPGLAPNDIIAGDDIDRLAASYLNAAAARGQSNEPVGLGPSERG